MVQWLGLHTSTAGAVGSIPGWGTKTLQAAQRVHTQKKFLLSSSFTDFGYAANHIVFVIFLS